MLEIDSEKTSLLLLVSTIEVPKGMGLMVKTWGTPYTYTFCDAAFLNFEILADGRSDNLVKNYVFSPIPDWTYSNDTPDDVYSSLPVWLLKFNAGITEALGALYNTEGTRLHLIAPYMAFDDNQGKFI